MFWHHFLIYVRLNICLWTEFFRSKRCFLYIYQEKKTISLHVISYDIHVFIIPVLTCNFTRYTLLSLHKWLLFNIVNAWLCWLLDLSWYSLVVSTVCLATGYVLCRSMWFWFFFFFLKTYKVDPMCLYLKGKHLSFH